MDIKIIDGKFSAIVYGFSDTVVNNSWPETGFRLMNKTWDKIITNNLSHKGVNIWVYGDHSNLFAGVELNESPKLDTGLDVKNIDVVKYAYYKHIGPYHQIRSKGSQVQAELKKQSIATCLPYIEIYGHWNNDETKLETELIWCLK